MTNLQLDGNEGILLQTTEAEWYYADEDVGVDELYLTNKNLIIVYSKSGKGFFSGWETFVEKRPLSEILVVNGIIQVEIVNDNDYGKTLQIIYKDGRRELFDFYAPKKELPAWKKAIAETVAEINGIVVPAPVTPIPEQKAEPPKERGKSFTTKMAEKAGAGAGAVFAGFNSGFKNVVESAKNAATEVKQQITETKENSTVSEIQNYVVPAPQQSFIPPEVVVAEEKPAGKNYIFCANCGEKLAVGSKFCNACGTPVGSVVTEAANTVAELPKPVVESPKPAVPVKMPNTQRQQEYVGTVLKCPNCGSPISRTTVICPACGYHITDQTAVSSVQAFNDQLMAIEATRKTSPLGIFSSYGPADAVDKRKLALIRNFPIPNTIDDITEFLMLAIANIDVNLSKKSFTNSYASNAGTEVFATGMPRAISNAWVSKMQQAYQKAKVMFPNDPAFTRLQQTYIEVMGELKIKVND